MRLLLDTHAFLWLATDQHRLSEAAIAAVGKNDVLLFISAVTPWEIGLLEKRKRLELKLEPRALVELACRQHGIEEIPLRGLDALNSTALPELHRDPFDRILVEIALRENMAIVSKDERLARYPGVRVIW
jgi:PIN domain nuclease of toxin-antitoxin system